MIEDVGALALVGPGSRVGQRCDPRRRFGASGPLRKLIAAGRGAYDVGFHDDVGRAANHDEMLDIVSSHQHQATAAVHGRGIDDRKARHPAAIGVGAEAVAGESAHQPRGDADQGQNDHECEKEGNCLHALCPRRLIKPPVCATAVSKRHGKRRLKPETEPNL
jgi:hypothetical protein